MFFTLLLKMKNRLVDHGRPRDADVAAIVDVASFRTEVVYTIRFFLFLPSKF